MRKKFKAFTMVELMVVVAVISVLATVSIIGYKSYIKRENINASITEAEQVREVLISQIVADSDGKIVITLSHNEMTLTYENGVLQFSSSDPAQAADTLEEIEEFDAAIRAAFPSLASLPGTLVYSGNDVYYHHLSVENLHELIANGSITEDDLIIPSAPYEANDVAVNIYTLEYITFDEKGRGLNGYDQIQFNIAVSSVNLELETDPTGKTDDQRTDVIKIKYFINPRDTKIEDPGFVNNNYTSAQANEIVDISIGEPDASGYGYITLRAKNATVNGPLLIKFTAGNVGRILRLRVFEKGRQTISVPKLIKKFEYKYEGDNYLNAIVQEVTPADCGIGDNLISNGIVGYTIVSENKVLKNPGDIVRIEFGIINKDYCWSDDFSSDTTKVVVVTLGKLLIPDPTLNQKELVYNGQTQTPERLSDWNIGNYSTYIEISQGSLVESAGKYLAGEGKLPGTYLTEFSIKNDYAAYFGWKSSENSQTLYVSWQILKKTIKMPKITLSGADDSNGVDYDGKEKTVTITYVGDTSKYIDVIGTIKATDAGDYHLELAIKDEKEDSGSFIGAVIGAITNSNPLYSDIYEWVDENGKRSSTPIVFNWHINPITIDPPTLRVSSYEYDGTPKPLASDIVWSAESEKYKNNVTYNTVTNVSKDKQYIVFTLNTASGNSKNVRWSDNSAVVKREITITPKPLLESDYPSSTSNIRKTYTGKEIEVKLSDFGSTYNTAGKIELSAGNKGTTVNEYTAYFKPTINYCYSDGAEYKTSTWNIIKAQVTKPALKTNLNFNYSGSGQTPFSGTVNSLITLSGDVPPQTDHKEGGLTTTVSIDSDNLEWSTGGSDSYTVTWYINKVNASVTKAPTAANPKGTGTALVNAGTASGGTIYYALGTNNKTAPTSGWSEDIPTGSEIAKTYYVWYKVVGDNNHNDTAPVCIESSVEKADNGITVTSSQSWTTSYSSSVQERAFTAAANADGAVTYSITSQKKSNSTNVSYFSIPDNTQAKLSMSASTPVNTYTVKIKATAAGDDGHKEGYKEITITVKVDKVKASITTAPTAKTGLTYTGEAQALVNAGVVSVGEIEYAVTTSSSTTSTYGLSWSSNIPTKTDAGTYYVWYRVSGNDNLEGVNATRISSGITISKVKVSITTAPTAKTGLSYNGDDQTLVNAGVTSVGTIKYAVTTSSGNTAPSKGWSTSLPTGTDAGKYYVWYKVDGNDSLEGIDATMISSAITISKGTNSIEASDQSITISYNKYSKTTVDFEASSTYGSISYSIKSQKNSKNSSGSWFAFESSMFSSSKLKAKNKTDTGTYTVVITAKVAGTDNYDECTKEFTLTITVK